MLPAAMERKRCVADGGIALVQKHAAMWLDMLAPDGVNFGAEPVLHERRLGWQPEITPWPWIALSNQRRMRG